MEEKENFFEDIKNHSEQFIADNLLLVKLKAVEKSSKLIASMFMLLLIVLISFFVIIFISIMGGYYFAQLTGSLFNGFAIIAGVYLLLFLILLFGGKRLLAPFITSRIIEIFFNKSAEHPYEKSRKL